MEKISCVYAIIHKESGKPYVGSALDGDKRWSEHRAELTHNYHDNQRLQNAWNKYGPEAFEFKILEVVEDPSKLLEREQYWMDKLQSYDREKGYNIRKKAESNFGLKHTPETRKKIGKGGKGKHNHFGKNNPFFGKTHSEETLVKMRKPKSEKGRKNIKKARLEYSQKIAQTRNCLNCGVEFSFQPYQANKRFCTHPCWLKYQTANKLNIRKELR